MGLIEGFSWLGLAQIMGVNIILSGDNALVVALACRQLPVEHRRLGLMLGTGAAMLLRIVFAIGIVYLMMIPLLKLVGSLLLLWIAVKLLVPEGEGEGGEVRGGMSLLNAVKVILIADTVMSFDNVISIAAAANGRIGLLALGIAISIPLMVVGAQMMLWLLDRLPWLMVAGGGLLGWIAGELAIEDPIVARAFDHPGAFVEYTVAAAAALFVMLLGSWLARRQADAGRAAPSSES